MLLIWPTIFGSGSIHFLFSYFYRKILFYFSTSVGMALGTPPPPPAKSLPYNQWAIMVTRPRQKCFKTSGTPCSYITFVVGRLLKFSLLIHSCSQEKCWRSHTELSWMTKRSSGKKKEFCQRKNTSTSCFSKDRALKLSVNKFNESTFELRELFVRIVPFFVRRKPNE